MVRKSGTCILVFALLILVLRASVACGQNLIPNAGFEQYMFGCNQGVTYDKLVGWRRPMCANWPDYFNTCNTVHSPPYGIPVNVYGQEAAHGGNGYCGVNTFDPGQQWSNRREYFNIDLTSALVAGQPYCVRLWMSRADTVDFSTAHMYCKLGTDTLPNICDLEDSAWHSMSQVTLNTAAIGRDGWTAVDGSFIAAGGETNLTIGEFAFDSLIDFQWVDSIQQLWSTQGYYYIDDVYLGPCDLGINEQSATAEVMGVYPNPVDHGEIVQARIPGTLGKEAEVEVIDAWGQTVMSLKTFATITPISTAELRPGVYVLRSIKNHTVATGRLVVD